MNIECPTSNFEFKKIKILYSDSWILSRIHYSRAKCLWPGPKDQVFNNGLKRSPQVL